MVTPINVHLFDKKATIIWYSSYPVDDNYRNNKRMFYSFSTFVNNFIALSDEAVGRIYNAGIFMPGIFFRITYSLLPLLVALDFGTDWHQAG